MKRTLRESLVDYDMALLRALAEMRGAVLTSNHRLRAAEELADQLATPASLAIALSELSPDETEPLTALRATGGWMEAPRFARRFGAVRVMGPGRLERERPWLSPANPAEALWYRALIFKGFRQSEAGVVEIVYVPEDVLALLPDLTPDDLSPRGDEMELALEPVASPSHVRPAGADVVEDVFGTLVIVRNRDVRLRPDGSPSPKDLGAINALCVSPVPAAKAADDDRLALIVRVGLAAGLVTATQEGLTLNPDPARVWLRAAPADRLLALQRAWRDDPGWNDLWHVPSLRPQPTGWRNDPVLTRQTVLGLLAQLRPGGWYGLDEWIRAVKASQPDFQRPDGDYTAWYIHDPEGEPLMGFEHWDQVEGALLRYLVTGPLHWLGATDLGFEEDRNQPIAFRLAESGLPLLKLAPPPEAPGESRAESVRGAEDVTENEREGSGQQTASPPLVVRDDFSVTMPREASLYTRFQLARFADFMGREAGRVRYRISPPSLARARRQGITQGQISNFLSRGLGGRVSAKLLESLESWYRRGGSVRLEPGVVLRVDRPETLTALRQHPIIAPWLGETLGPQAVLVPRSNLERVRRWLAEQGYLESREM